MEDKLAMAEEKLNLMELAIMDAVRKGMIERTDIGKHARTIVSDYDAAGPTLWTEPTVRIFADALDSLVDKGYLAWKTYILQIEPTEKGKKFTSENATEMDNLPRVDDSTKWFEKQRKKIVR
jgi:hypothetical protein